MAIVVAIALVTLVVVVLVLVVAMVAVIVVVAIAVAALGKPLDIVMTIRITMVKVMPLRVIAFVVGVIIMPSVIAIVWPRCGECKAARATGNDHDSDGVAHATNETETCRQLHYKRNRDMQTNIQTEGEGM